MIIGGCCFLVVVGMCYAIYYWHETNNKHKRKENKMAKHKLGEIWKEGRVWKIQAPKGIDTVHTKREALIMSKIAKDVETKRINRKSRLDLFT